MKLNCAACKQAITTAELPTVLQCGYCGLLFHSPCQDPAPSPFQCMSCESISLDPLSQPISVLGQSYAQLGAGSRLEIGFEMGPAEGDCKQVRAVRRGAGGRVTWPDAGALWVKGLQVAVFRPLDKHSAAKFRKDQYLELELDWLNPKKNTITIEQN
jgi:hypothetical protein